MPLIATRGAASAQGFGEFAQSAAPVYIEDVFSTYLIAGSNSTVAVNNGIDLSGKGGLVWQKNRAGVGNHYLEDTARRAANALYSNLTNAQAVGGGLLVSGGFSSNGFTTYVDNGSSGNQVSWTFREQPKFFDIVTYTGNGTSGRTVSHNLGSTPGCLIVKKTSGTDNWFVWHRSLTDATYRLLLNSTVAETQQTNAWNSTAPTSTVFTLGDNTNVNENGATYVAYLFAHNAGGFGLSGTDNVISCGSYTGNGSTSGPTVTLGYEPQWVLIKRATGGAGNWVMIDSMRGFVNSTTASPSDAYLVANTSAAESTWGAFTGTDNAAIPLATGFQIVTSTATLNANAGTYIYIAIRRGPMKVPTSGTSVYYPLTRTGDANAQVVTGGNFPTDLAIYQNRPQSLDSGHYFQDRLRGGSTLTTNTTGAEYSYAQVPQFDVQSGVSLSGGNYTPNFSTTYVYYYLGRAPGFFDVVCYTSTVTDPTTLTLNHNLGAVPQMMIKKARQTNGVSNAWRVYHIGLNGGVNPQNSVIVLNSSGAETVVTPDWGDTAPTSTQFTVGYVESGISYVTYLFASCPGVSKVGSYTGTGALQTVNCGFTGGARFVLIKRTDSTGDWWVYDSARGISSGNDPYLFLNSTAAEVTNTNYVDTTSVGFQVTAAAPAGLNANGGTYIFLAIA